MESQFTDEGLIDFQTVFIRCGVFRNRQNKKEVGTYGDELAIFFGNGQSWHLCLRQDGT